ncbi:MAG TPA: hypothetical protein VFI25_19915 [Planctomycetota bacterium]|nr:hypothetical protein [Planctomycetota bacterium]
MIPLRRSRIAWWWLAGPIAAALLWPCDEGRTPTAIYVANSPIGNDANSGRVETAPKATLTGPRGALAAMASCGPESGVILLRAGSTFVVGPIETPAGIKFRFWDPARTGLPVTIATDDAAIAGWTIADGVSLNADVGR